MESSLSNHLCFTSLPVGRCLFHVVLFRHLHHQPLVSWLGDENMVLWHTLGLVTVETGEASSLSLLPPPVLKPFPTPDSCPHPQILSGQTAGADGAHNYFEVRTRLRSLSFPRLYRTEMKMSPPELTETRFGRLRPHALSLWPSHSNETQANRSMTSTPPCCF